MAGILAEYPHQHLKIRPEVKRLPFRGDGRGNFRVFLRNREQHAARLLHQIEDLQNQFEEKKQQREGLEDDSRFALRLEVESEPGYPLKFTSLTQGKSKNIDGIYLLNVRKLGEGAQEVTKATILVPYGRLDILEKKVRAYADPAKDKSRGPSNAELLSNIRSIRVAALEALWTELGPLPPPGEFRNWELWISREPRSDEAPSFEEQFNLAAFGIGLAVNEQRLKLPDHIVVTLRAKREDLEGSLDLLNTLTEIRLVRPCTVDLTELTGMEQHEWIQEALERIQMPGPDAPAVCLLDTGVNRAHPLLAPLLDASDVQTLLHDSGADQKGHGTGMAGLAAYDDLRGLMLAIGTWPQEHRLESVKMINQGDEHDPPSYGKVTQIAALMAETNRANRQRAFCMALTQPGSSDKGQPSSWSAAVDSLIAGSEEEGEPKRLMLISAGNIRDFQGYRYPDSNHQNRIENPAQAWNAVCVGAYTRRTQILEDDDESTNGRALAGEAQLCPCSRTSRDWEPHWPIKPDLVMEGGNMGIHEDGHLFERNSLEPVTTEARFQHGRPLKAFNATSAATASASRLMAILQARYPDLRPETHRGLLVHSARWTTGMLGGIRPHEPGQTGPVQNLLREVGFGTPDVPRLLGSGSQGVTMIIEDEIQPYDPTSNAGSARLGNFNLYDLPWPKELMDNHPDMTLTLRATLSTYIHPNPGTRCWEKNQKYKYASHLLRFDFKRHTESERAFEQKLKKLTDEEENEEEGAAAPSDPKWAVGPKLRGKAGSLVQDIWKGSAADLREMGQLAVFPVKGWFATRKFQKNHEFHNCHHRSVRYSLIISLDAEQEIGLYNEIANLVGVAIDA